MIHSSTYDYGILTAQIEAMFLLYIDDYNGALVNFPCNVYQQILHHIYAV